MADQEDQKSGTNEFTQLLAVLTLFFGAMWVEYTPLKTLRPPPEDIPEIIQTGVEARLWQDPFSAAQRQLAEPQTKSGEGVCSSELPGEILQKLANKDQGSKIIALGAMIQEANWASVEELQGRRQRYAVISALNRFDYLPDDAETLKCLKLTESGENSLIVPYELFSKKASNGQKTKVALFWLNEPAFHHKPLEYVRQLFGRKVEPNAWIPVTILGPGASGTVRDLVTEADSEQMQGECKTPEQLQKSESRDSSYFSSASPILLIPLAKLVFLSSSATAPDEYLLPVNHDDQALPEFLQCKGIFFDRLTLTDDKLIHSLVEELALRGLGSRRLTTEKAYVALVSEWDTLYAQTVPQTFKSELNVQKQCKDNVVECPVLEFSYLRGLDGLLPGKGGANASGDRNNNEPKKDNAVAERADGDSQVDYLRRLTDRLSNQEQRLRNQGKELKAIGVFGSDVYDKLLVLEALRTRFPSKVLFTTDLDAAYLLPEKFKSATHNLVVASAFGLTLNPYLQGRIPPFRDSYQTGTFLASQIALSMDQFGKSIENPNQRVEFHSKMTDWFYKSKPRVFEIGRTQAVNLNAPDEGQSVPCTLADCQYVHPTSNTWIGKSPSYNNQILPLIKRYIGPMILAALLWLLLCLLSSRARQLISKIWSGLRRHPAVGALGFIALLVVAGTMNYLAFFAKDQEPFSWVDGVSMWPAELIRIVTLLLVIALGLRSWRLLHWNDFVIRKCFFPNTSRHEVFNRKRVKQSLPNAMRDYWPEMAKHKPDPQDALAIWKAHINSRGFWAPALWAIMPAFVFILFGVTMLSMVGFPDRPYRGETFGKLDFGLMFVTLFAVLALAFFVAEAISRCNRMAQQLKKTPKWPITTLVARGLISEPARKPSDWASIARGITCGPAVKQGSRTIQEEPCDSIFDPLLDMQLIAERTDALSELVYYPFLALALFIASRMPLFDNWYTPWQLALLFLLSFGISIVYALRLRNNAEDLRTIALEKLSACILAHKGLDNAKQVVQLEEAIKQVKSMDKGIFKPFRQQPWLKAIMLPLGSWSGFTILEFFIRTTFL